MNGLFLLFVESFTSVALSLAVLYAISRPLTNVLNRICPDEHAAAFWLGYTRVMLMIAPLLLVLTADMFSFFSTPLDTWRFSLIMALGGILISLYMVGERIKQFPGITHAWLRFLPNDEPRPLVASLEAYRCGHQLRGYHRRARDSAL
jgi:hypothetical protein